MSNYDKMLEDARLRFTGYDMSALARMPGVEDRGTQLATRFFAREVLVDKVTGQITLDGEKAGFSQGLSIYDWLCDRAPDAVAAGEVCPVGSLPGVFVGGSGLGIKPQRLATIIHDDPDAFRRCCEVLGGREVPMGDIGYRLEIFPGLPMCLKFYFADEEFPPSLTFLWDKNILRFVRYETVYYIAGCLQERLLGML